MLLAHQTDTGSEYTHHQTKRHTPFMRNRRRIRRITTRLSSLMDNHALSVLADAESWDWPVTRRIQKSEKQGGHCQAITPKLLSWLIKESQCLGGTVLDQFWEQVRECHPKLKENGVSRLFWSDILVKLTCQVDNLTRNPLAVPSNQSSMMLFQGIDRNDIDFTPYSTWQRSILPILESHVSVQPSLY
jgi:hypothetical protein